MPVDLIVANGRLVSPHGSYDAAVAIDAGRIVAIGEEGQLPTGRERIDCEGRPVLPGIVDPHVHMGGGAPYDEICLTESRSAAVGGVTTILQYRRSPTSFLETFDAQRKTAEEQMIVDTQFHFILSSMEQVEEIPTYYERWGISSYKFYMGGYPVGNPVGLVSVSDAVLYAAMEKVRELGPYGWCMVHCEDDSIVCHLTERIRATGAETLQAYTDSRPDFVEEQDVLRAIWLARLQRCPLYVPHTTIGEAVTASAEARAEGVRVVLETCPHYLALTADDARLAEQGAGVGKVSPALRDDHHQSELWRGLGEGWISTIGSDHVPIAKTGKGLWDEKPGFAGLATSLPVVITEGVLTGRITLERLVETMCWNPARIFGLHHRKGAIRVGADADLVIVDMDEVKTVGPDTTGSKYTSAFEEVPLRGWPITTIRRGEVIFRDGEVTAEPGSGTIIDRAPASAAIWS